MTNEPRIFNRPRPVADLVSGLTSGVFGKKNLLFGKMLGAWRDIAGAEIAAQATPLELKLSRPPKAKAEDDSAKKQPGQAVLTLAVNPAYALELSYQKGLLIERLNMFFGYPAIKDVKIIQNSEVMTNKPMTAPFKRPLPAAEAQKIDDLVTGIQENDLQTALKNLGKAIASRSNATEKQ